MKILSLFLLFVCFSNFSFAVNDDDKPNDHEHHHHSDWEIGIAIGGVYLINEKGFAPGLHFHLLKRIPKWERFSIGLGLETVLDEHTHFNTAVIGKFDIWKNFSVLVAPGVLFLKDHDHGWETAFSSHFELLYEFQVGKVHLGPVLEYSFSKHDNHLMLGLHLGYSF